MRSFILLNAGGSEKLIAALLDDGFVQMPPEHFDGEDRFVCAVCRFSQDNDRVWLKWRPKLVFSFDRGGRNSELYTWQKISFPGEELWLGRLFEREFQVPQDWQASYNQVDLTPDTFYKVVADITYRYMVAEVIDETAEWCGHMSSVVRKI